MVAQEIVFSNQAVQLAGTLYKPEAGSTSPAMVVLHAANGGTRQFAFYQHLTRQLPAHGIAVLLFDRRGSGQSAGNFETASFDTLAGDGRAAVEYLQSREDIDKKRIGLFGISQGGWIAPLAAAQKPDIAFLIIVSGCGVSPAKQMDYGVTFSLRQAGYPEHVIARAVYLRNRVNEYYRGHISREAVGAELGRAQTEPWFQLAYISKKENLPEDVTRNKWWHELDYDPLPIWQQIQQPALFLFAEQDQWVPVAESMSNLRLATAHMKDVTITQVEGTDHLMGQIDHQGASNIAEAYVEKMMAWLSKRLVA